MSSSHVCVGEIRSSFEPSFIERIDGPTAPQAPQPKQRVTKRVSRGCRSFGGAHGPLRFLHLLLLLLLLVQHLLLLVGVLLCLLFTCLQICSRLLPFGALGRVYVRIRSIHGIQSG